MIPDLFELVARDQLEDLRREAEQMRLVKVARPQSADVWKKFSRITHWFGSQMVAWGMKLQDQRRGLSSPVIVAGVGNGKFSSECC